MDVRNIGDISHGCGNFIICLTSCLRGVLFAERERGPALLINSIVGWPASLDAGIDKCYGT